MMHATISVIIAASEVSHSNFEPSSMPAMWNRAAAESSSNGRNVLRPVDAERPRPRRIPRKRSIPFIVVLRLYDFAAPKFYLLPQKVGEVDSRGAQLLRHERAGREAGERVQLEEIQPVR